jgi:hypothetical protein
MTGTSYWLEVASSKGLRPGSAAASKIRILFAFDPAAWAVLLVVGDHRSAASSYPRICLLNSTKLSVSRIAKTWNDESDII